MSLNQPSPDSSYYRKTARSDSFPTRNNNNINNNNNNNYSAPTSPQPDRSINKKSNNAQGGQPRAVSLNSYPNNASVHRPAPNASHLQPPTPALSVQTTEKTAQASGVVVQKPPSSQAANVNPDTAVTPTKAPGDASKSFAIQFGSVSPGTLNVMQIPARTSSAPPNLVEQQKDQARRDLLRQAQPYHIPSVPKQQTGEAHQIAKASNDIQVPIPSPVTQTQKFPVHIISGVSRPMPFYQVPVQFGGPTSQLQSQPIPMPLLMGSGPQLRHAPYVPGLHPRPHPMQVQGMLHQGQGYNFTSQMGQQMPPQLVNMGMGGAGPQFPQLQPSNTSVGSRVAVKITDPKTREELRLENASVPSSRPVNYYPNPLLYPPNSTLNPSSQPHPRSSFPVPQTASSHKPTGLESSNDVRKAVCSVASTFEQVTIKSAPEKLNELATRTSSVEETGQALALSKKNTKNDQVNKQSRKGFSQPPYQVLGQFTLQGVPSHSLEHMNSFNSATSETSGAKPTDSSSSGASTVDSTLNLSNDISTFGEPLNLLDNGTKGGKMFVEGDKKDDSISNALSESVDETEMKSKVKVGTSLEVDPLEITEKDKEGTINDCKKDNVLVSLTTLTPDANENTSNTSPELTVETKEEGAEDVNDAGVKEKPVVELNRSKSSVPKGKKKRKEFLQKADAAGTTSDLYNAYKGPEERKELETTSEKSNHSRDILVDSTQYDVHLSEKGGTCIAELDDWEDAEDISTSKIEIADNILDIEKIELMAKKYTRDFLMKFLEKCTDLPDGFEITSDVANALIVPNVNASSRESHPSPGRIVDRSPGGPRRGVVVGDENRWNKVPAPLKMDGYGGNFRPGQGANHGVLRNPRGSAPSQGILSGLMQRSNSDADRWQRATGFQKDLIPSPQTPAPVMHKAERKYQVGIITDEEQAKQRHLKAILNKLTPQNFEKLFEQVKAVNIDNAGTLTGVISQIFDKALMEPTFCEMYANFCYHLAGELPDFSEDNEKITFKRLLLNKCQEEFERGEREQEEADRDDVEGEVKQSPEEREEKRVQARRRMLGNIRLIGELYKKKMLTERIMHECITKLLGQYNNPDEEDIESLCKLMSTIGEMIDHPKAKEHMDAYFDMMSRLSNNMKLSSRVRFMLRDAIDLRKNKWQERRKVEGPKKIDEVHRDAAQERHVQAGRLNRGPGSNSIGRNYRQPMEFSSRGSSNLPSPTQMGGGYRGLQSQQSRGFGVQDARFDDMHSFNRTLSLQRPVGEESIMLGPQGGLARGMSSRGQPLFPSTPLAERPNFGDSRRVGPGLNGTYDEAGTLDRNLSFGNQDLRNGDRMDNRSCPSSRNVGGGAVLVSPQNVSSGKVWPEEQLREMSLSTIKEFYSARDEKEVALCVKDLNSPSFYPTMISLWVSDSFEKKDMERDSLAKLLTNLSKSPDSLFNHDHLIKGFESVLSSLEDAVNDAPKAGEFLGRIFANIVVEDVIPFSEIGQLILEGGEEKGSLVEVGLAAEVVGTILEIVKSEKGDAFLNQICMGSGSKLERFRPPNSNKILRLDKFI